MKKILQIFILSHSQFVSAGVTYLRSDLKVLGDLPCKKMSTYDFWAKDVFDSQITIGLYQFYSQFTQKQVMELVDQQSQGESHKGYYKGDCGKEKFYILTTPSPVPVDDLNLQTKLDLFCKQYFFDQVSLRGPLAGATYPLRLSDNKSSTISCELGNSKQEWFLLPPKNWRKLMVGFPKTSKHLSKKPDVETLAADIFRWVENMRTSEKKQAIRRSSGLDLVASSLNSSQEILHNRKAMEKELVQLRKKENFQNAKILMEDRVQATTLEEAKDLLWWSPRHRNLILSDKITRLGLDLNFDEESLRISIVGSN